MRRSVLALVTLLLPLSVLALSYTDKTGQYKDGPFPKPETAAISVLTELGVMTGNPDGTFAPGRALNRAEFLKIALLSSPHNISPTLSDAASCFPDVDASDWFSRYVCLGKVRGVVSGYPDGMFRPANPVNYAEALKMLGVEFGVDDGAGDGGEPWYQRYVHAAGVRQLLLPLSLTYDRFLTRGQVARLAASYIAESRGELAAYRAFEQGQSVSSSSASSESQAGTPASSVSSSSVDPSSSSLAPRSSSQSSEGGSSASSIPVIPARSHLLLLGERGKAIASARFTAPLEPVILRIAQVKLKAKENSIQWLYLVDGAGVEIGKLTLATDDANEVTWKATFEGSGAYRIPQNGEPTIAVEALLKKRDDGGVAEKLVQVDSFMLTVMGEWSGDSYSYAPVSSSFPKHQTVQGRITKVENAGQAADIVPRGTGQLLAAFTFTGETLPSTTAQIENLEFQVMKSGMAVQNWQLGMPGTLDRLPCSVSADTTVVSCLALPASYGTFSALDPRTLRLYGDVAVDDGAQHPSLEVDLSSPGAIGENGAIRWTDGVGHYTWIEADTPVARGTRWSD